jgi:hypothetical protein
MFVGSILFRFIGVLARWVAINLSVFLRRKSTPKSFKSVWKGSDTENVDELSNRMSYEMSNIILGFIVIMVFCIIVIKLGW